MFRWSLLLPLFLGSSAIADETPPPLTPAEAAKKVDQQVTVELAVKSTGGGRNRYLNSAPDFSQAGNFTIFIPQAAMPKFTAAKIDRPDEFYYGKTIQVTGAVTLNREKPQIVVSDPAQIKVMIEKSGPPVHKVTHIYKQVGALPIKADSYRFDEKPSHPVVVWIHGGAPINGHRESVPAWLMEACRQNSFVLVSLDYRLAPETPLREIIADIEDAFRWIRHDGPQLLAADPQRIGVVGSSAGGYLALTSGYRVKPRPNVLVSLWGYGELIGPWQNKPSLHPRHQTTKLTGTEADALVAGPPISDSRERKGNGGAFYNFCRQQGSWPQAVSGWDPGLEAEKFVPYMPVNNVTPEYPPTLLVHGEQDTDVPPEQSQQMLQQFQRHNVERAFLSIPGAEHGLAGAPPDVVQSTYRAAAEILRKHLTSP